MSTEPPGGTPGFEQLVAPHLQKLYRLAYRFTGQVADAEDLLQDVLAKLYERRDELSSIDSLGPWLSRVLYNQFIDKQRQYARKHLRLVGAPGAADGAPDDVLGNLESPEPGPATAAEQEIDITRLGQALAALSLEQRSVVMMHDAEGYKLSEIQRITGVPVGTLKSRLHRARARIRTLLEEMEPFGDEPRVTGVERR